MNKPLLSIIIPVYNLEDYINNCLDSIYRQNIEQDLFEVIAVDDGSRDNSLFLLQQYAQNKTNLRVLHQENGGVSKARNYALSNCAGEYVTFVDGDDELLDALSQVMFELSNNPRFDVMYCLSSSKEGDVVTEGVGHTKFFDVRKEYKGSQILSQNWINGGSVCRGVYRKSSIIDNDLSFAEGIANGEDTIFTYLYLSFDPVVIFRDIRLNLINVREGSASHSISKERVAKFNNSMRYLRQYRDNHNLTKLNEHSLNMCMYYIVSVGTAMYIQSEGRDFKEICGILEIDQLWKLHVIWAPRQQMRKIRLLNISYWLFYQLTRIKYS